MLSTAGVALTSISSITLLFVAHQRKGLVAELEQYADFALDSLTLAAVSLDLKDDSLDAPILLPSTEVGNVQSRGAIFTHEGLFLAGVGSEAQDLAFIDPSRSLLDTFSQTSTTSYVWQSEHLFAGRRVNARGLASTSAVPKVVIVEISNATLNQTIRQTLWDATQVALGAGALSTLLALLLSRTIARPLKAMMTTTDRIASGHFAERVPINKGGYELSSFAESFNVMAAHLQKTIARQRALVRYSLDAIVVLNRQGHVVELNPFAEKLFGCREEDMLGSQFAQWAIASPWNTQFQAEAIAISNGQETDFTGRWHEIEAQQVNGRQFPADLSITHTNVQGELLFTVTLRNTSERRQVELQLQQSEARFRQIVHSAPIGIALVDTNTKLIQQVNPALCGIVGHDESDLLLSPFEKLGLTLPVPNLHQTPPNGIEHATSTNDLSINHQGQKRKGNSYHHMKPRALSREEILSTSTENNATAQADREDISHINPDPSRCHSEQSYQHPQGVDVWVDLTVTELSPDRQGSTSLVMLEDITQHKQIEFQLRHEALHDPLTGLANRALMLKRLSRACDRFHSFDSGHDFAVLFLDCDRFKSINDTLGHEVGDLMLIALARRLEDCVREGDTVARLGGDEFTVLLTHIREPEEAIRVADRILDSLQHPLDLNSHQLTVTASIGIVNSHPRYRTAEEILKDADAAMYQAKTLGRAQHAVFHG
ncbi:MAG: diguanylate cyclase [Synechococcus sp.]